MQMLKNTPFQVICLFFLAIFFNIWHGRVSEAQFVADLNAAVQNLHGSSDRLQLSHITRFPWDRVFVFSPNTPTTEIAKIMGKPVPDAVAKSGIERRDDIHLLVFMDGERVSHVSAVSRNTVDFFTGLVGISLAYNNAVFARAQGERVLALAAL